MNCFSNDKRLRDLTWVVDLEIEPIIFFLELCFKKDLDLTGLNQCTLKKIHSP